MGSNISVEWLVISKMDFWSFQSMVIPLISVLIPVLHQNDNLFKVSRIKSDEKFLLVKPSLILLSTSKTKSKTRKWKWSILYYKIFWSTMFLHLGGNFSSFFLKVLSTCAGEVVWDFFKKIFFWYSRSFQARKVTLGKTGLAQTGCVQAEMGRYLLTNRLQVKVCPCRI